MCYLCLLWCWKSLKTMVWNAWWQYFGWKSYPTSYTLKKKKKTSSIMGTASLWVLQNLQRLSDRGEKSKGMHVPNVRREPCLFKIEFSLFPNKIQYHLLYNPTKHQIREYTFWANLSPFFMCEIELITYKGNEGLHQIEMEILCLNISQYH